MPINATQMVSAVKFKLITECFKYYILIYVLLFKILFKPIM